MVFFTPKRSLLRTVAAVILTFCCATPLVWLFSNFGLRRVFVYSLSADRPIARMRRLASNCLNEAIEKSPLSQLASFRHLGLLCGAADQCLMFLRSLVALPEIGPSEHLFPSVRSDEDRARN
jgi:hypothetical protein